MKQTSQELSVDSSNPVFYSTIQHPEDYEGIVHSQVQKKLLRGSSYGERMPKKKKKDFQNKKQPLEKHERAFESQNEVEFQDFIGSQKKSHQSLTQYQQNVNFPNQKSNLDYQVSLDQKQNVFYDNASKSNSPVKVEKPKFLAKNSKQLSFSNITSEQNLQLSNQKKKKFANPVTQKNTPKSMMRLEAENNQMVLRTNGRVPKSFVKNTRNKGPSEGGRQLRKKGSRVSKKKTVGSEYKGISTKRRGKKTLPQKEESMHSKSYRNPGKVSNYMQNAKKKQIIEAEARKLSGFTGKINVRQDEEKPFSKYGLKNPRTCKKNKKNKKNKKKWERIETTRKQDGKITLQKILGLIKDHQNLQAQECFDLIDIKTSLNYLSFYFLNPRTTA